jgi:hypothetical protein
MPGRIPQDPSRLAGHRKVAAFKLVEGEKAPQPALPKEIVWPKQTREWWKMWGRSPLSADFTENDWSELLDAAKLHALLWSGSPTAMLKAAPELRNRVAKFGATPLDRQRLRITLATADLEEGKAEDRQERKRAGARSRRGPHLVDDPAE